MKTYLHSQITKSIDSKTYEKSVRYQNILNPQNLQFVNRCKIIKDHKYHHTLGIQLQRICLQSVTDTTHAV